MLQLLIESRASHRPSLGGSLLSTVGHAAIVTALVVFSARAGQPEDVTPDERPIFVPTTPPVPPVASTRPAERNASPSATPAALGSPPIPSLADIDVGLPPVDLRVPVTSGDDVMAIGPRGRRLDGVPGGNGTVGASASVFREEQVDKPVFLAPGMTAPRYPDGLRAAGISGSVMVEFVVDTTGRVEPGSIQDVHADHALFSASVRAVLPGYRFISAESGGRKVRQLVRLPFRFDLHRD